ncbi:hypothetical protein [Maricaulis sp. MIT060901]|uniref:hypothetical protein n=1 Tax=Maricaulis sp. MIT060901 TaxID=3096993 RepID=UPI0039997D9A
MTNQISRVPSDFFREIEQHPQGGHAHHCGRRVQARSTDSQNHTDKRNCSNGDLEEIGRSKKHPR